MNSRDRILDLFEGCGELSIKEIIEELGISKQTAHLVVNRLCREQLIEKMGSTPKTIYRLVSTAYLEAPRMSHSFSNDETKFLDINFLAVTETGHLLHGPLAFEYWCDSRNLPVKNTLNEYLSTKKQLAAYYNDAGLVNGLPKLKSTKGYDVICLDQLYYLDFYAIEPFGRTRLGTLWYCAKQGQNKFLMDRLMDDTALRIEHFLKRQNVDAVGFIPPTIRRQLQLMKCMQDRLDLKLPVIGIKKFSGIIPIPQRSLASLDERIRNADNTFVVMERRCFRHIVLIDDAVGSGATLNQVAAKIKNKGLAGKVTGLALVGSFKGFDVITGT